jgi:hypothetical protein
MIGLTEGFLVGVRHRPYPLIRNQRPQSMLPKPVTAQGERPRQPRPPGN